MAILTWKSWESTCAESCACTALACAQFQTAPTSLLTPQTCGGGLCLGHVKIMNSRSALLCAMGCAGRRDADGARDASKAPANRLATSRTSKREVDGPITNRIFYSRSFEKDLQLCMEVLALATDGEEGFQWRVVTSTWERALSLRNCVEFVSV